MGQMDIQTRTQLLPLLKAFQLRVQREAGLVAGSAMPHEQRTSRLLLLRYQAAWLEQLLAELPKLLPYLPDSFAVSVDGLIAALRDNPNLAEAVTASKAGNFEKFKEIYGGLDRCGLAAQSVSVGGEGGGGLGLTRRHPFMHSYGLAQADVKSLQHRL